MELSRTASAVHAVAYHIVWCPKYRKDLPPSVQADLKALIPSLCEDRGWGVEALEVMSDHVHVFVRCTPTDSPASVVKILKGVTARFAFERHPSLRKSFRKGHLWSPSYYVGSVGHVSEETVRKYVEEQKKRTPGRPRRERDSSPD